MVCNSFSLPFDSKWPKKRKSLLVFLLFYYRQFRSKKKRVELKCRVRSKKTTTKHAGLFLFLFLIYISMRSGKKYIYSIRRKELGEGRGVLLEGIYRTKRPKGWKRNGESETGLLVSFLFLVELLYIIVYIYMYKLGVFSLLVKPLFSMQLVEGFDLHPLWSRNVMGHGAYKKIDRW